MSLVGGNPRGTLGWRPAGLVLLFTAVLFAHGQAFIEVSAKLELLAFRGSDPYGGSNAIPRTVILTCTTGSNSWRIDHDHLQGGLMAWYYDGTNVFNSIRVTESLPEEQRRRIAMATHLALAPPEVARSHPTITIWPSRDGHPLGDPVANIAWLAFGSGTYLKREGRLIPLPLDDLHHTRDRFAYTDKTETFRDALGLPRSVDLFLSKALFLASEEAFDRECFFGDRYTEATKQVAEKLPEGMRMFHYRVTASTNFARETFPLSFECYQNGRPFEQNADWCWRCTGRLTSIRSADQPEGLMVAGTLQTIVDYRLHDDTRLVHAIIYQSSNTFALPTNTPELQDQVERRAKRIAEHVGKGRIEK